MIKVFFASIFFGLISTATLGQEASFEGCLQQGDQEGRLYAQQFCRALENRYHGYHEREAFARLPAQFCSVAIANSCKRAMSHELSSFPLCRQLVASNWNQSSFAFNQAKDAACPTPHVERCPFAFATVHKGLWCKKRLANEYWAYIDGLWWRFVSNQGGLGDERRYVVQHRDGAIRIVERFELSIVSAR